jgi:hypothetical protein
MFSAFFIDQWSHDSNWMIESWENEGGMADGKLDPGFGGREGSGGLWCACSSCLLFFEANCGYRRISDALRRWKLTSDGQVQVQVQVQVQTQTQRKKWNWAFDEVGGGYGNMRYPVYTLLHCAVFESRYLPAACVR